MNINSSFNMNSVMTTDINITLIETTFLYQIYILTMKYLTTKQDYIIIS